MSHLSDDDDVPDAQLYTAKKRNLVPAQPTAAAVAQVQQQQQPSQQHQHLHLASIEEERSRQSIDQHGALSNSQAASDLAKHQEEPRCFPLRPCLRLRDENGQLLRGNLSRDPNSLNIRWHDINGNGELVEVYEYEPSSESWSEPDHSEKSCCTVM